MCEQIISKPNFLITSVPKAKGNLIWLLTRHDYLPDAAAAASEWELKDSGYNRCVDAINVILKSIQSQKEWIEVFQWVRSPNDNPKRNILAGSHNAHRKALNVFYLEYAGRQTSEIDTIKNRLPENMGWYTVWNDNYSHSRDEMKTSLALLERYDTRCGLLKTHVVDY